MRDKIPSLTKPASATNASPRAGSFFAGLSGKLLALTVLFVMFATMLTFVPSIATKRLSWLTDRLATAAAAGIVIDGLPSLALPRGLQDNILMATGAKAIVLRKKTTARMIVISKMPPMVNVTYDLTRLSTLGSMGDALNELLFGGQRIISVSGPIGNGMSIELVMDDADLHAAMLTYAREIFLTSFVIALITAALIFLSINRILIRPIRRITVSIEAFAADPSSPANIMVPQSGHDELALAGRNLAAMQSQLLKILKQQKNLADLGLAVAKINHDMRNILSSAQLLSDRIADVDDPLVKGLAERLLKTLDRAVGYTSGVLDHGRATEAAPKRRIVKLADLANEVGELLELKPGIDLSIRIDPDLEVHADAGQLFQVIYNLCNNAAQALAETGAETGAKEGERPDPARILLHADRMKGGGVRICVDDNGPGMPPKAREHLFQPFRGSARSGGTGLGLAITRELVLAHGGTIELVEKADRGTRFCFDIPDNQAPRSA